MKHIHDRLRVEVAPDALVATVVPVRRYPRKVVKLRHLDELLRARGVVCGLDSVRMEEFLAAWRQGVVQGPWVVAQGKRPEDPRIQDYRRVHPPARSGRDPVELLPLFVRHGEAVIAVQKGRPGKPGLSVRGNAIPCAAEPDPLILRPGEGLEAEGSLWRARRTGFLRREGEWISVTNVLSHRHDLPPGEYRWDGPGEILGDVPAGATLHLAGTVTVGGNVHDTATIQAGGDVLIRGIVAGAGQVRIQAEGAFTCKAIESATIVAVGHVVVEETCRGAHVRTLGTFRMPPPSALLCASRIEALQGAELQEVGDAPGASTIVVGATEWLDAELLNLEEEIRRWHRHHARLYEEFHARYTQLLEDRASIHRLPAEARERFEAEHQRVTAEQERVDAAIARLRTRQSTIGQHRRRDEGAVIRVSGRAPATTTCTVRRRTYRMRPEGVEGVVLHLAPGGSRVVAVPCQIHDASLADLEHVPDESGAA